MAAGAAGAGLLVLLLLVLRVLCSNACNAPMKDKHLKCEKHKTEKTNNEIARMHQSLDGVFLIFCTLDQYKSHVCWPSFFPPACIDVAEKTSCLVHFCSFF